jgi:flagellar basal-body rod protein FlgC
MSAVFSALETSRNGLNVYKTWLDAIADNIANVNTVRPAGEAAFAARYVVAEAIDYGSAAAPGIGNGARVNRVAWGPTEGRLVYAPDHPYADEEGLIRVPDIDMNEQMTAMIMAQRSYQANISVVERARNAYESALRIGRQ